MPSQPPEPGGIIDATLMAALQYGDEARERSCGALIFRNFAPIRKHINRRYNRQTDLKARAERLKMIFHKSDEGLRLTREIKMDVLNILGYRVKGRTTVCTGLLHG